LGSVVLHTGRSQAEVANHLGVARQNASRWHARWRAGGLNALRSAGPTTLAPRLSDPNLPPSTRASARVPARTASTPTMDPGPHHDCDQAADRGHPSSRARIGALRHRLQRPARLATERDEQPIQQCAATD
jgi:hypothetical protein